MTTAELIYGSVYVSMAFLLAAGIVFGLGVLLQAERNYGVWIAPLLVPIAALGISVSTLLSGRSLKYASIDLNLQTSGLSSEGSWVLRSITLTMLGICATAVISRWFKNRAPLEANSTQIFIAFMAFYVCNNVLNSAFGTEPVFAHTMFYALVVFAGAYVTSQSPLSNLVSCAKFGLAGMMVLSLLVAVIKPELAVQPDYRGWVPGLNSRLWGVGSNPNSIGPLALVLLLCEYLQPYRRRWMRWSVVAVAAAVFLYAQSKTVFVAAAGMTLILAWYRVGKAGRGIDMRFALLLLLIGSGVVGSFLVLDVGRIADRLFASQAGTDIATLSGRWQIWSVASNEWLRNPLFGYGPDIWGPEFRQRIGMQSAFSAHNQLMHSLSSAGTLGAVTLFIYIFYLGCGAFRMSRQTRGVSVALFALVVARCITETPLTLGTLFSGDFLTHLLLFQIVVRKPMEGGAERHAAGTVPTALPAQALSVR